MNMSGEALTADFFRDIKKVERDNYADRSAIKAGIILLIDSPKYYEIFNDTTQYLCVEAFLYISAKYNKSTTKHIVTTRKIHTSYFLRFNHTHVFLCCDDIHEYFSRYTRDEITGMVCKQYENRTFKYNDKVFQFTSIFVCMLGGADHVQHMLKYLFRMNIKIYIEAIEPDIDSTHFFGFTSAYLTILLKMAEVNDDAIIE